MADVGPVGQVLLGVERLHRVSGNSAELGFALRLAAVDLLQPLVGATACVGLDGHRARIDASSGGEDE
jgi:hypothetical protein